MDQLETKDGAVSPLAAVLAVISTWILSLFLGVASYILIGTAFALVFGELLIIVVPLSYMLYRRVNITAYIGIEIKPKTILLGIAMGALLFLLNLIISVALTSILGTSEVVKETNSLFKNMSGSTEGLLSLIISLSLAGICEEFTFRGFMQNAFNSRYSWGISILISSLFFGIFHFDPQLVYIVAGFLMGLFLGYIYHHWHSYVISTIAHSAMNLIVLAILLLA